MMSLRVQHSGAPGVEDRETLDADFGVPFEAAADPRLLPALTGFGYSNPQSANRFVRPENDLELVIDVLAPSYTGRLETNQPHGDLVLDEIPGLSYALGCPGLSWRSLSS